MFNGRYCSLEAKINSIINFLRADYLNFLRKHFEPSLKNSKKIDRVQEQSGRKIVIQNLILKEQLQAENETITGRFGGDLCFFNGAGAPVFGLVERGVWGAETESRDWWLRPP